MVYYYILFDVFDNENMKHRKHLAFVDAFNQVMRKKWLYINDMLDRKEKYRYDWFK